MYIAARVSILSIFPHFYHDTHIHREAFIANRYVEAALKHLFYYYILVQGLEGTIDLRLPAENRLPRTYRENHAALSFTQ